MRLNRSVGPAFAATHLLRSEVHIDEVLTKLFGWLDKFAEEQKPTDLDKYLAYAAYDILGEVVFSKCFGFIDQGKDVGGTLAAAKGVQAVASSLGYIRWLFFLLVNPVTTWLGVLPLGFIYNASKDAVDQRRNNPDSRFDGLASWLKTSQENPERLSLREVYATSTIAVQAGAETVSCESHPMFVLTYIQQRKSDLARSLHRSVEDTDLPRRCDAEFLVPRHSPSPDVATDT